VVGESPHSEVDFMFAVEIRRFKQEAEALAHEELEDQAQARMDIRQRAATLRQQAEDALRCCEGGATHYHTAHVALEEALELLRSLGTEADVRDNKQVAEMEPELAAAKAGLAAEARVQDLLSQATKQMHDQQWDDAVASVEAALAASNWELPLRILVDELAKARQAAHAGEMGRRLKKLGAQVGKLTVSGSIDLFPSNACLPTSEYLIVFLALVLALDASLIRRLAGVCVTG
jgi:hypothetical protein